jgi:hypothetical protein
LTRQFAAVFSGQLKLRPRQTLLDQPARQVSEKGFGAMRNELSLLPGGGLTPRDAVRGSRAISRVHFGGELRQTVIDVECQVSGAKLDAVGAMTGQAMRDIGQVAQLEVAVARAVPLAIGRVALLAEQHALLAADEVSRLHSRLRCK